MTRRDGAHHVLVNLILGQKILELEIANDLALVPVNDQGMGEAEGAVGVNGDHELAAVGNDRLVGRVDELGLPDHFLLSLGVERKQHALAGSAEFGVEDLEAVQAILGGENPRRGFRPRIGPENRCGYQNGGQDEYLVSVHGSSSKYSSRSGFPA